MNRGCKDRGEAIEAWNARADDARIAELESLVRGLYGGILMLEDLLGRHEDLSLMKTPPSIAAEMMMRELGIEAPEERMAEPGILNDKEEG